METNPNDTAFPIINPANNEGHPGLSKREFFAALMMTGHADRQGNDYKTMAEWSVHAADYLIEALNKPKET